MPPGRKPATPALVDEPEEAPMTEYEKQRMQHVMRNSRVFRSLRIREASEILKKNKTRPRATNATREVVEQGILDTEAMQDLEDGGCNGSTQNVSVPAGGPRASKRVMAPELQRQDEPRVTRQRTKELATADEVPTANPHDTSANQQDALSANDNTQFDNQNEQSTHGKRAPKRHLGRDLDMISRGLRDKIPVHISEGKLRPEEPLQAAKLASEAGIILWDHIPIFTHWKHYKEQAAKPIVKNFNDKLGTQFTIDQEAVPVKDAFSDLLKRGQRR